MRNFGSCSNCLLKAFLSSKIKQKHICNAITVQLHYVLFIYFFFSEKDARVNAAIFILITIYAVFSY